MLSSKDGLVKIWDLETHHCFQTIPLHRSEVWSLEVFRDTLMTGSSTLTQFKLEAPTHEDKVTSSSQIHAVIACK